MFSPSLSTKQKMELPFDHSTRLLAEILREAATSASDTRGTHQNWAPFWGLKSARFPESDFKKLGALYQMMIAEASRGIGPNWHWMNDRSWRKADHSLR
jgi:hypothetical protein